MQLHQLKPKNKNKNKKRIGRGGKRGTYSGKGQKGQKSRAGRKIRPAIRDLIMRLPKLRGFKNKSLKTRKISVNINDIENKIFSKGIKENFITMEILVKYGLIKKFGKSVKILAEGELKHPIIIKGLEVSKKAKEKIQAAGGKISD